MYIYTFNGKWIEMLPNADIITTNEHSKNPEKYYKLYCGFDIETTRHEYEQDGQTVRRSYMYVWQFIINDIIIIGRTWDDFLRLLDILRDKYTDAKLLILIHNISFEMSFLLQRIKTGITNIFCKDKRKPIFVEYMHTIRFQDSYALTGCSLAELSHIYNLPHKKAVGDLDYSLKRNSMTELTAHEKLYIYLDVIVLRDYAIKLIDEIRVKNFNKIPLTKTQLFLNKAFNYMTKKEKQKCHDILLSFDEYVTMNKWLFRGGYVHGNIHHIDEVIQDVQSVDFTSSYPAVMNHDYVPVGKFRNVDIKLLNGKTLNNLLSTYCCWIECAFFDIKLKGVHTIESRSKIVEMSNDCVFDNGRLFKGSYVKVHLTELDFEVYQQFYNWEQFNIISLKIARRGKLPAGLLKALNEDYVTKAKLKNEDKKETTDYILAKQNINSAYGGCCKKIPFNNWTFSLKGWEIENNTQTERDVYHKWTEKTNILPFQFACWITSHARHHLLMCACKVGNDCLYMDTDSMKIKNYDKHRDIIKQYNDNIAKQNAELLEISPYFSDLGMFDENDGHYESFKMLGCKRYCVVEDNKPHSTIAGLPKKTLVDYCKNNDVDIMDVFNNGMKFDDVESGKLTTHYEDESHTDYIVDYLGNGEQMTELSSCTLYEIPFELSMTTEFLTLIKQVLNLDKKYIC